MATAATPALESTAENKSDAVKASDAKALSLKERIHSQAELDLRVQRTARCNPVELRD